eukprot:6316217-Amphidinium_carterae.1
MLLLLVSVSETNHLSRKRKETVNALWSLEKKLTPLLTLKLCKLMSELRVPFAHDVPKMLQFGYGFAQESENVGINPVAPKVAQNHKKQSPKHKQN